METIGQQLGEKNILEEFYELIEKHRLDSAKEFHLGDFYDILSEFDLAYQKFNSENNEISNSIITKYLTHSLYVFLIPFKFHGFTDSPFFYAFKRFISWFTVVLEKSEGIDSDFFFRKNISVNFPSLWNGPLVELLRREEINLNLHKPEQYDYLLEAIEQEELRIAGEFEIRYGYRSKKRRKEFYIFGKDYCVYSLIVDSRSDKFEVIDTSYEMTIDIEISRHDNDGQKLIETLNLFVASIANIQNVKVEIEDIKTGSLIARVRIYLKDLVTKEETKAVLETTKEAVIKVVTAGQVSHSEVKKSNAETNKIISEIKLLEKELDSKPSDIEVKLSNALDLERRALENEALRNQITKDKIDIILKLSELSTKGLLQADDLKIDINEIFYLLKQNNKIESNSRSIDSMT